MVTYAYLLRKRTSVKNRFRKLIPTLEYDVLYNQSSLARMIGKKHMRVHHILELLEKELDIALIDLRGVLSFPRVMRIGEQEQDLSILSQPIDVPEKGKDFYRKYWENIAVAIKTRGYATHLDVTSTPSIWPSEFGKNIFKDFVRENELPVAVLDSYRQGIRFPIIVYHPSILRQVRDKKSGID